VKFYGLVIDLGPPPELLRCDFCREPVSFVDIDARRNDLEIDEDEIAHVVDEDGSFRCSANASSPVNWHRVNGVDQIDVNK